MIIEFHFNVEPEGARLIAGLWLTGLLPFALLLRKWRRISEPAIVPFVRWLLAKIITFIIAVGIGAVNLLRLKPQLAIENRQSRILGTTTAQLQFKVHMELFLGTAIVAVVAVLGILPPALR